MSLCDVIEHVIADVTEEISQSTNKYDNGKLCYFYPLTLANVCFFFQSWKNLYKASLNKNWRLSVAQCDDGPKKAHIRFFNDQGFPTKLGISLELEQLEWVLQMKLGVFNQLHMLPLVDRYIIFHESHMGYLRGCTIPLPIIKMLPTFYPQLLEIMK